MSLFSNLLRRRNPARDQAIEIITEIVKRAAEGAHTLEQIRERLAQSAKAGDLDDLVTKVVGARRAAELYEKSGIVP